jgi:hypothetical protein
MGIDETVARLREQAAEAQRRGAGASAAADVATARAAALREDLQAQFAVSTVAEAKALLADLDGRLQREVAEVDRLLRLAEGA